MNNKLLFFSLILLSVLSFTLVGCEGGPPVPRLENSVTAHDPQGDQEATVFGTNETFYAVTDLRNAPENTDVRAVWTAVDVEGVNPDHQIQETILTTGSNRIYFELSNPAPWPEGRYRVDLYLEDQLQESLEFEVR